MNQNENNAILTISLMAAFADGQKSDHERAKIKELIDNLGAENSAMIFQKVLLKQVNLEDVVTEIESNEMKLFAYEMAVCVADADGVVNTKEREFLDKLKLALELKNGSANEFEKEAETLTVQKPETSAEEAATLVDEAEINKMVLNYSILNGALELLPQTLATMAIIPLQTKMVYRIGKKYGYELDTGHIKEFIATAGVGLTSQMVEGLARKFIGKFAKKLGGGLAKTVAGTATGAAFSFASTYGLGKLSNAYYSGGRKFDMSQIKSMFERYKNEGTNLYSQYQGEIQNKARNVNFSELLPMIKGNKI